MGIVVPTQMWSNFQTHHRSKDVLADKNPKGFKKHFTCSIKFLENYIFAEKYVLGYKLRYNSNSYGFLLELEVWSKDRGQ